ncbi:MAG: hypothetical protein A2Y10_08300 [Planctomycetes bacterium GWF2_41_51]|nr:MAG: hypothetical protein A2Y10_08300 [Planctomycetes bacterium GWF2_41_51]HBG25849.1 hypothetical protein [Phycisphaerales bacterium]
MIRPDLNNSNNDKCQICKDLLASLHQFVDILNEAEKHINSWLTVDEVANELKISKSIVYRLIRNKEIEAVNVTPKNDGFARKSHYRIQRKSLDNYLNQRKVNPLPDKITPHRQLRNLLKVKNHLGL